VSENLTKFQAETDVVMCNMFSKYEQWPLKQRMEDNHAELKWGKDSQVS
jgi:hypothetical protein